MIPIDHGLSIPDSLEVSSWDLAWLSFSQAEKPFSQRTLDFIDSLDVERDLKLLERNFKIRPKCLRNMKISTILLKKAAACGLNLAEIGRILCRPDEDDGIPSLLEKIVQKAELCSNLVREHKRKFEDSMLFMVDEGVKSTSRRAKNWSSSFNLVEMAAHDAKPLPRIESFNQQRSPIDLALGSPTSRKPTINRSRRMTEGPAGLENINCLNNNTSSMINKGL